MTPVAPWIRHCAGLWRKFNVCPRLILRSLVHFRLANGLPYDPLGKEFLSYLQKHKPERLAIPQNSLEEARLLRLLQLRPESTENYTKLQGSYSVSESLGRMNIPSDEHAYIGMNEHSYIKNAPEKLLPIHRLRSFFCVSARAEGVRRYFLHTDQKILYIVATVEQL